MTIWAWGQSFVKSPDVAGGQSLVHEGEGIRAGVTGHLGEALHKEAPVLIVPNGQGVLFATRCQIGNLHSKHMVTSCFEKRSADAAGTYNHSMHTV